MEKTSSRLKLSSQKKSVDYDKDKLHERAARISGNVAVIKVCAATEMGMKEKEPALKTTCIRLVPQWKKVSHPAVVWHCCELASLILTADVMMQIYQKRSKWR